MRVKFCKLEQGALVAVGAAGGVPSWPFESISTATASATRPQPDVRGALHCADRGALAKPCPAGLPGKTSPWSMPRFPFGQAPIPTTGPLIDLTEALTIPWLRVSSVQVRKEIPNQL